MTSPQVMSPPARPTRSSTFAERQQVRRQVLAHLAVFGAGALSFLQVANFTATALSIVCLALAPAYLLISHRPAELVPVALAALGWLGYIISCLAHDTSILAPNAIAPAAFGLYLLGITVLAGRSVDRIATVLAGIALGTVFYHLMWGVPLTETGNFLDVWKYGIAGAVTILVLFALVRLRVPPVWYPAALALIAGASLVMNYRSHALICLVSAAILFSGRVLAPRIGKVWQYVAVFASAGVFAVVMPMIARAGWLGSALQAKIAHQDSARLPFLFAGRTEPPLSITAILEHPILGWGSAERLTPALYTAAEHFAIRFGYPPTLPFDLYWRVPPDYTAFHSILFGFWGEGGILALALPVWLLCACVLLVWRSPLFGVWAALVVTVAVQGFWDLLYSPWTYNLPAVYACVALLFAASRMRASEATGNVAVGASEATGQALPDPVEARGRP